MEKIKTVLISTASLPHDGVASWTTELNYLLERENELDYIIGPYSNIKIKKPTQIFLDKPSLLDKVRTKINYEYRFNHYVKALKKVLKNETKIILQIKDNYGLLKAILSFINKNKLRKQIYVQYHYHSFLPFIKDETMIEQIDELVLLTNESYKAIYRATDSLALRVSILNDGVDSTKFKPLSDPHEKTLLRERLKLDQNKLIFVWCAQDRKKKGLDLILEVWETLVQKRKDIELLIFGLHRDVQLLGVRNMGQVPNELLISYHQAADFYLFPSLCQEGFGLSLVEALKCGNYCISALNGASQYILKNGDYGTLIRRPHVVKDWLEVIEESILVYEKNKRLNPFVKNIPTNIYDMHDWYIGYNSIITEAKKSFKHRYYI